MNLTMGGKLRKINVENTSYMFTIPTWTGMWMYIAGDVQYLPQIYNIAHVNYFPS